MTRRCFARAAGAPRVGGVLVVAALLPFLLGIDLLQSRNRATQTGNAHLQAGKAEDALAEYDKAAEKLPSDPGVQFNRGAALYALQRYEEATEAFLRATEAKQPERKAQAFYNLGNSLYQAKKFKEAAAAFKKSLAYDPADARAKWNLELALRKKADEEKNQDQNKNDKQDKGDKDKQAENQGQEKDDKPDDQKGDSGNDKGDQPNSPKQDPQQPENQDDKDKQANQQPAKQDDKQPPSPGAAKPERPPEQGKGQQAQKPPEQDPKGGPDQREIEAILDNLERSPKSLEQELARLRARNRRAPAKDW